MLVKGGVPEIRKQGHVLIMLLVLKVVVPILQAGVVNANSLLELHYSVGALATIKVL
jgi:hypothetical protein